MPFYGDLGARTPQKKYTEKCRLLSIVKGPNGSRSVESVEKCRLVRSQRANDPKSVDKVSKSVDWSVFKGQTNRKVSTKCRKLSIGPYSKGKRIEKCRQSVEKCRLVRIQRANESKSVDKVSKVSKTVDWSVVKGQTNRKVSTKCRKVSIGP